MKQHTVLIAGGTGLIGQALSDHFKHINWQVRILSRSATDKEKGFYHWDPLNRKIDPGALNAVDAVINLSGQNLLGGRWTNKRKTSLRESRIKSSEFLISKVNEAAGIKHFIQASAMGYFGNRGNELLTEDDKKGEGFLSDLCGDWESTTLKLKSDCKPSILRIGLYLHQDALIYKSIKKLSKFYLAAGIGTGNQFVNYTHRDELNVLTEYIISDKIASGLYHAVGKEAVTLNQLLESIARTNGKSLILPNIPSFLLKLLLGEASHALLDSTRIESKRLKGTGIQRFDSLQQAVDTI